MEQQQFNLAIATILYVATSDRMTRADAIGRLKKIGRYHHASFLPNWIAMQKDIKNNPGLTIDQIGGETFVVLTVAQAEWDKDILALPNGFFD